jgi:hypothetical protein
MASAWLDLNCNMTMEDSERASGRATVLDSGTYYGAALDGFMMRKALADQTNPSGADVPATDPGEEFAGLNIGTLNNRDPRGETVAANAGTRVVVFEWYPGGGTPLITKATADANCAGTSPAWMHVRVRITSDRGNAAGGANRADSNFFGYGSPTPAGPARDGEVEDYTLDLDIGLTPAVVTEFRATADVDGNNWLRWTTASEIGVSGFRVERFDVDGNGKGKWTRVHSGGWLPSAQSLQGAEYQLLDNDLLEGETASYRIIERSNGGKPVTHGPYVVDSIFSGDASFASDSYAFEFLLDVEGILERQETISENAGKAKGKSASPDTVKLGVSETGVQFVPADDIAEAFDVNATLAKNWLKQGKLELKRNGTDVAWFDTGDGLLFYGVAPDNTWSTESMYWLSSNQSGNTMAEAQLQNGSIAESSFVAVEHSEQDNRPFLEINHQQTDDFWYWTGIVTFPGYDAITLPAASPGALAEDAMLTVALQGFTQVQHEVEVSLGGDVIGTMLFNGTDRAEQSFAVPAAYMGGSALDVTMRTTGAFGYSSLFIEHLELEYLRSHSAQDGMLSFGQTASGALHITGLSDAEGLAVLDISNAQAPVWLDGGKFKSGAFEASFASGDFIAANASAWRSVSITPVTDEVKIKNPTEYLVIAPEELMEGAQALVDYRSGEMKTQLVSLESIYDHVSFGEPDPRSIRNYLVGSSRVPDYVVLVGDGAYDYKDFYETGYNLISGHR